MSVKISVIIPVYNTALYLNRCLDSVINQTLNDIEIICVNDKSTDGSLSILEQYAKLDKRVKIINNKKNEGVSAARNKAIKNAVGEYVSFVDSDDAIDLDFLEKLYFVAIKKGVDIAKGQRRMITLNGIDPFSEVNGSISKFGILGFNCGFCFAIYKSSLFKNEQIIFPEGIIIAEDDVFLNRLMLKNASITCVDDAYYTYYRREKSVNTDHLSTKKLELISKSFEIMIDEINIAYKENIITGEVYDYLFEAKLLSVFFTYYRNSTKNFKKACIRIMQKIYNQNLRPQTFIKKIGNIDEVKTLLTKCNSYSNLITAMLVKTRLRQTKS